MAIQRFQKSGILQSFSYAAYTTPYRHIHSDCRLYCNKDKCNQKSTNEESDVDCNMEFDWLTMSHDESKKYKYWEISEVENVSSDSAKGGILESGVNKVSEEIAYSDSEKGERINESSLMKNPALTHTDQSGQLNMVDIATKPDSSRLAIAVGTIFLGEKAFRLVEQNKMKKGDVLTVAKLAGIMAAKRTSDLIPLCHNIPLSKIDIDLELVEDLYAIKVSCLAKTHGKTGVEMEALTGVAVACVTIYDMCKAVTKEMVIGDIKLTHKYGGKSGNYNISGQ